VNGEVTSVSVRNVDSCQACFPVPLPQYRTVEDDIFERTNHGMFGDTSERYVGVYSQEPASAETNRALRHADRSAQHFAIYSAHSERSGREASAFTRARTPRGRRMGLHEV
jgi:hypothetical protein